MEGLMGSQFSVTSAYTDYYTKCCYYFTPVLWLTYGSSYWYRSLWLVAVWLRCHLLMSSLRLSYSVCATCVWQLMGVCQLQPAIQMKIWVSLVDMQTLKTHERYNRTPQLQPSGLHNWLCSCSGKCSEWLSSLSLSCHLFPQLINDVFDTERWKIQS